MTGRVCSLCAMLTFVASFAVAQQDGLPIPNLLGLSRIEAISLAKQAGFRLQIGYDSSCGFPKDVISNQQPPSGTLANKGQFIIILENKAGGFKMPQLIGQSIEAARQSASNLGMSVDLDDRGTRESGKTCQTPKEWWSLVEDQQPVAGSDICLASRGAVRLKIVKLKEKLLAPRICDPDRCIGPSCHNMR